MLLSPIWIVCHVYRYPRLMPAWTGALMSDPPVVPVSYLKPCQKGSVCHCCWIQNCLFFIEQPPPPPRPWCVLTRFKASSSQLKHRGLQALFYADRLQTVQSLLNHCPHPSTLSLHQAAVCWSELMFFQLRAILQLSFHKYRMFDKCIEKNLKHFCQNFKQKSCLSCTIWQVFIENAFIVQSLNTSF